MEAVSAQPASAPARRVYPLSARDLTEEEIAVVFAMTSRRPEPFDEIRKVVTAEKAAEFHERWVLGYGHASVAEHAVLHLAVENVSRLCADALEDNRLASYTEKSTRFQLLPPGSYFVPPELEGHPRLRQVYVSACEALFSAYRRLAEALQAHLERVQPPQEGERESAYRLRLRRRAAEVARFLLPSATLTQVGVTMNARSLEHAVRKLLSSDLQEERDLGEDLKREARRITPTLVKYADRTPYLVETQALRRRRAEPWREPLAEGGACARLVDWDRDGEVRLATAFLYRESGRPYEEVRRAVEAMPEGERIRLAQELFRRLGPHDAPLREAEMVHYTFELVLDYGAYREFKRHRMQTYLPQPLTVELGVAVPRLVVEAGQEDLFRSALAEAERAYRLLREGLPPEKGRVAEYLVTHAHLRRVLARMSLRECWHLFRLRTGPQAHETLREVMEEALRQCVAVHPALFAHFERVRRRGV